MKLLDPRPLEDALRASFESEVSAPRLVILLLLIATYHRCRHEFHVRSCARLRIRQLVAEARTLSQKPT